jgi:hypothetical protein
MAKKPTPADDAAVVDAQPMAEMPRFDVVQETPMPAQPAKGTGKTLALGVVLGIGAAALGYGAAWKFPIFPTNAPAVDLSAITARLDALDNAASTSDVQARLAQLEGATPPDLSALEQRLTALEQRLSAEAPSDDLRAELADIRAKLAQTDPAPAIKSAIAAEMANVQKTAQDMVAAVDAAAKQAAAASAKTLLAAALDTGMPYAAAAQSLGLPDALAKYADTGIPSLTSLKDAFPDAARAGLDAALRSDLGATWAERVTNFLRSQTGARALTPQDGNDPDAVLSRIEAGLRAADMGAVMAEIAALPESAKTAMADWIALAQIRADALAAYADLTEKGQ